MIFVGLVITFIILMWNIRKYYRGRMSTEMQLDLLLQWLSILYATFGVSYGLRMGY